MSEKKEESSAPSIKPQLVTLEDDDEFEEFTGGLISY